jgi:threonine dehydrogenase-like Zn-dependent dehydrogenase
MPRSRAVVLDGSGNGPRLQVRELDVPELGPSGELVLRTVLCGICGSDHHRYSWATAGPTILGHEILARVERVPPGWVAADGSPLEVGDLVVPETRIPCHTCRYCRGVGSRPSKQFDYAICPNQRGLGGIPMDEPPLLSGGWSDFIELPRGAIVHHVPPEVKPSVAVLLEPFSIGMKATRTADVRPDDVVVILGPGPIGLFATVAAHEAGARKIVLAGRAGDEKRLALGRELGAHATLDLTDGDPAELLRSINRGELATRVIEATGAAGAFEVGVQLLGRGGVLTTVGGHRPGTRMCIDPSDLVWKQLDIRGSALGANSYEACLSILAKNAYPFEKLVTHRFKLPQIEEALETFGRRGDCIKPVIEFD